MNSRVWIDKKLLSKWVNVSQGDELALLNNYLKTKNLSYLLNLYRPYMHLVYGVAYKFIQDPRQSQEIVYCIFKKLIKEVNEQEIRVFSTWLYNLTLDFCKQWRNRGQSEVDQIVALGGSTHSPIAFYEQEDDVFENEISNLEEEAKNLQIQQEKCADLFFNQQKCFREIADLTGWEVSQIKQHVRNAKRKANIYQE